MGTHQWTGQVSRVPLGGKAESAQCEDGHRLRPLLSGRGHRHSHRISSARHRRRHPGRLFGFQQPLRDLSGAILGLAPLQVRQWRREPRDHHPRFHDHLSEIKVLAWTAPGYAWRPTTKPERSSRMKRYLFVWGLLACAALGTGAQTHAPYPPFTAEQAKLGKQLIVTTLEIRKGITNNSLPAEPYKIIGNLYFVGDLNGEAYLLTS